MFSEERLYGCVTGVQTMRHLRCEVSDKNFEFLSLTWGTSSAHLIFAFRARGIAW
jgi:hypothetical protein